MKNLLFIFSLILISNYSSGQKNEWHIVPGRITTQWADSVDPSNVLKEYPRPQLRRNGWLNLNGLWQYAIVPKSNENIPATFQGNILVPFAVESSLSGVGKTVGKDSLLWYQREFVVPSKRKGKKILLHFGAVDWRSEIYVNDKKVGSHEGGYDPFTIDITDALNKNSKQKLTVMVWDPTDEGPQPRGKQVVNPHGIWYTPVTGIWQTVWMETVPETHISFTRQTPDVDKQSITVSAGIQNLKDGDEVNISAWKGNEKIAEKTSKDTTETLTIANPETWSPSHPFLYDLKLTVMRKGKVIDEVQSYFAMRKISVEADNGVKKMMLNNKFLFEFGPLDQGWWPDGLYTAPTDNALKFDIEKTKEMGFNMIRKHIKVEPARWYYYCDKLGMLVWQDMPSGDLGNQWEMHPGILGNQTDKQRTPESEGYYHKEWNAIMNALYNFPCIVVWTPFNEAWGQFKTAEIANMTKQKDPSRLVNSASGGNYYFEAGDILDLHNYPDPKMPRPEIFGSRKALVLGEFGGLGLPVDGHTWQQKNWGYQSFKSNDSLFIRYNSLIDRLEELVLKGLSAAVYTQTTDVEGEVNGFMTYDRKVMKMPIDKLKQTNEKLYNIIPSPNTKNN
jgi:beta-galactosidase/beta-glucuronidase